MSQENKEFILRWINDIAPKLAPVTPFKEWIRGFENRYPAEVLVAMEAIWDRFRG